MYKWPHFFQLYTYNSIHVQTQTFGKVTQIFFILGQVKNICDMKWKQTREIESERETERYRLNCRRIARGTKSSVASCELWLRGNLFEAMEKKKLLRRHESFSISSYKNMFGKELSLERETWDPFFRSSFDVFLVHLCQSMLAQLAYSSFNGLRIPTVFCIPLFSISISVRLLIPANKLHKRKAFRRNERKGRSAQETESERSERRRRKATKKNKQKITKCVGNDRHLVIHIMLLFNELNISMRYTSRIFMVQLWGLGTEIRFKVLAHQYIYSYFAFSLYTHNVFLSLKNCLRESTI